MYITRARIFLYLFCVFQTSAQSLLDPSLQSLINSKTVSHCEVLVQFRGPLTKSVWNRKFVNRPNQALKMLKEKFSTDVVLNKLNVQKIYWLNRSILISLDLNQLQQLQSRPDVNYISLNRELTLPSSIDQNKKSNSFIKDSEAISHALKTLQISQAWNRLKLKGQNLRIGFIGRGFSSHPDLNNKEIIYRDFNTNDYNSTVVDNDTNFLGLMAADNLSGRPLGVAPKARFIVADIFDHQNKTKLSTILEAMQWITNPDLDPNTEDGAEIIANSWGYKQTTIGAEKPLWDATVALKKMDVLSVFPAGENGPKTDSILSPGAFPHTIAVGAINRQLVELKFSSKGPSKWENVSYDKPDFLAPGVQIESLLPGSIYGLTGGTNAAAALITASLALIRQSNSNLPWKEILKISKQTSFSYNGNAGITQVYDAAVLAQQGAKINVQIDGPADGISKIFILDESKDFMTSSMGHTEFYLREGSYRVAFTAEGFAPQIRKIVVNPKQNLHIKIELKKSKTLNLNMAAYDAKNRRIPAMVEFLDGLGQKFIGVTQSMNEALPEGIYPVRISSRGYKSISTSIIHVESSQNHRFKFDVMPLVAVVNQNSKQNTESQIAQTLQQIGIQYDLLHSPQSFDEIEAYQTLIWESGDALSQTVNQKQQLLLTKYLRQGGSVLITGQDLAYWLQGTQFLTKILGADFEQDHSSSLDLVYKKFKLQLYDKTSTENQLFVDTLKPVQNDSKCYLNYNNGLCAGVLRYHPKGKSIILGLNLENLPDAQRKLLVNSALEDLNPAVEHLLDKIENTYLSNRASYFQIMKSLETFRPNFAQKASQHIEIRRRKSVWRPLLHDILHDHRRHIFDQLYDID